MGLFGSTTVYVSSVTYNMAGEFNLRPNFLKTLVASNVVMGGSDYSMSETINRGYLTGPGIKARSFHRWTRTAGYDQIGWVTANVMDETDVAPYMVASHIPHDADKYVSLSNIKKGPTDYSFWADQYMMEYHLEAFGEAWVSTYDAGTNQITITRADGITTYTFTPTGMVEGENYIYATYNLRYSVDGAWFGTRMWIYRIGSGIAEIDNAVAFTRDTSDEFMAIIPVRIENEFLSPTYKPEVYAQAKKAYKKATNGQKFSDLVATIQSNASIDDIDHAYVVFGASLNTKDKYAKKYLYTFFDRMLASSLTAWSIYETYISATASWAADYAAWRESIATWKDEHPGEPYPPQPTKPDDLLLPARSIIFRSNGLSDVKLHMQVKWTAIRKLTGTGLSKPDATVGEIWWSSVYYDSPEGFSVTIGPTEELAAEDAARAKVKLYWQKSATEWEALEIVGLTHHNLIYAGQKVVINVNTALADLEESGFIVPIHYDSLKAMSLVDSTQMMLSSTYLVINCYEVVKTGFFGSGFFKIFLFAAMIAVTIAFPPLGASSTTLFTTVGTALGFAGLAAMIVGALAFSLISMIVMKVLGKISVAIFGEKFGAIIAAVATFVAMSIGTGTLSGQSLSASWGNMMSAQSLIGLTNAVGNGVAGYVAASTQEFIIETKNLQEEYKKQSSEVSKLYAELIGYDRAAFNPLGLTALNSGNFQETEAQFLSRTLMTGSDIAEMSMDMLSRFAEYTLKVDL